MRNYYKYKLATIAAVLMTVSACALTPQGEDPVQMRMADLERRLAAIERILANGSLVDLTVQVDNLQRRVADLQGRVESQEHEAADTSSRQRDLYTDLDERIQNLERNLSKPGNINVLDGGELSPGELPVPGGSDRDNYQAAFELLKEQRYKPAAMAFQQFLVSYPDSQLADNAQYWLAESYYVTAEFDDALKQFSVVVNNYPRSRKLPDALLKVGYCNYELQRWDAARQALRRVQVEHADSTAARLADQRLKRMEEEGH